MTTSDVGRWGTLAGRTPGSLVIFGLLTGYGSLLLFGFLVISGSLPSFGFLF